MGSGVDHLRVFFIQSMGDAGPLGFLTTLGYDDAGDSTWVSS